jgi:hypothetical protein
MHLVSNRSSAAMKASSMATAKAATVAYARSGNSWRLMPPKTGSMALSSGLYGGK